MKNIRYLCNMKTKNLYMNNGEPMCAHRAWHRVMHRASYRVMYQLG